MEGTAKGSRFETRKRKNGSKRKMRSVVTKVSWLLILLLLTAQRETQRSRIAPVQP